MSRAQGNTLLLRCPLRVLLLLPVVTLAANGPIVAAGCNALVVLLVVVKMMRIVVVVMILLLQVLRRVVQVLLVKVLLLLLLLLRGITVLLPLRDRRTRTDAPGCRDSSCCRFHGRTRIGVHGQNDHGR